MKNTIAKTAGALLLSAFMLTAAEAQPRNGKGYGPGDQGNQRMHYLALDLSEEQQEQMQALRLDHYKVVKPLRNQMAELKAREQTLISEETVDMKAVNKVIDQQTALQNKTRKLGVEHRLAVREILTDEQLMIMDQRRQFAKGRRGHNSPVNGPHHQGKPNNERGFQKNKV